MLFRSLKGTVNPATYTTYYDFEEDAVTNGPTNPPASGVTRGTGNLCTAGVADYTDADVRKSFPDAALKAFPLFKIDHWNLLAPLRS